jgi:hypothetical protein
MYTVRARSIPFEKTTAPITAEGAHLHARVMDIAVRLAGLAKVPGTVEVVARTRATIPCVVSFTFCERRRLDDGFCTVGTSCCPIMGWTCTDAMSDPPVCSPPDGAGKSSSSVTSGSRLRMRSPGPFSCNAGAWSRRQDEHSSESGSHCDRYCHIQRRHSDIQRFLRLHLRVHTYLFVHFIVVRMCPCYMVLMLTLMSSFESFQGRLAELNLACRGVASRAEALKARIAAVPRELTDPSRKLKWSWPTEEQPIGD